jgi:hypothetical protein
MIEHPLRHKEPSMHLGSLPVQLTILLCCGLLMLPQRGQSATPIDTSGASVLREDPRLGQVIVVRVSRMTLEELFQRMQQNLKVSITADRADVSELKVDVFANRLSAAELLGTITSMLNIQDSGAYRWSRSGRSPAYRYTLFRSLASRQREAKAVERAQARLLQVVTARVAQLGSPAGLSAPRAPRELPSMRRLLAILTPEQLNELTRDRLLVLTRDRCTPGQGVALAQLVREMITARSEADPQRVEERIARYGPPDRDPDARAEIYLEGDAPQYNLRVGVWASRLAISSDVCQIVDPIGPQPEAQPGDGNPGKLEPGQDPIFLLRSRPSDLMGDVLAEIAARTGLNVIADDYTQRWLRLTAAPTPRRLSAWLDEISRQHHFEWKRNGSTLLLRNRHWALERGREISPKLLKRWSALIAASPADRLAAAIEIARLAPPSPNPQPLKDRLRILADSPEVHGLSDSFTNAIARLQFELVMYGSLSQIQRTAVTGPGLRLTWDEMTPEMRQLFARRVKLFLAPGLNQESLAKSSLGMRFNNDMLQVEWDLHDRSSPFEMVESLALSLGATLRLRPGQPLPALETVNGSAKNPRLNLTGPLVLCIAPLYPRPYVSLRDDAAYLNAVSMIEADVARSGFKLFVAATDATPSEVETAWKKLEVTFPPYVLTRDSVDRLGIHHLPTTVFVDEQNRVFHLQEGYSPGDEAAWLSRLRSRK